MIEQSYEAYETLASLPDDPELLDLIKENAGEVRRLAIASDVIAPMLPGVPASVTDVWQRTAFVTNDTDTLTSNDDGSENPFRIDGDMAFSLNIEIGTVVIGDVINNFIMTMEEPSSGLKIRVKKTADVGYAFLNDESQPIAACSEQNVIDLLHKLSGDAIDDEADVSATELLLHNIDIIGQRYGVVRTEYRMTSQLLPAETMADTNEGAVLLVETETPRESKIALAVERLQDYHFLDAQVLNHFGAEYFGVSDEALAALHVQTDNRKVTTSGLTYSICDIDAKETPRGIIREIPLDLPAVENVVDTMQQVTASGGDYLLPLDLQG